MRITRKDIAETIKKGIYKHYKGGLYRVIGIGINRDTFKEFVVYEMLYDSQDYPKGTIWLRAKDNFLESVKVDNKEVKRFAFMKK